MGDSDWLTIILNILINKGIQNSARNLKGHFKLLNNTATRKSDTLEIMDFENMFFLLI